MKSLESSRSWFCVFNNPADHGYTGEPQEVCERLREEWVNGSDTRTGAWAFCKSKSGLLHVHMVLEDTKNMRFTAIKSSYCQGMHFEPTKGNKKQADDYINKRGKFEDKEEEILYICYHGEIKGKQGKRTDLDCISDLITDGLKPSEILEENPRYYTKENIIKKMYFRKRYAETEFTRDVKVFWHYGSSGSGKSYSRKQIVEKYGEEEIYYLTTFGSGAFDNYEGQKVLWIDDYRGEFRFQELLRYLDVYKAELPARYNNVKALWNEVHITSVLTPQFCYSEACRDNLDRIEQLLRRITCLVYHYKVDNDYLTINFSPYETLCNMQSRVFSLKKQIADYETIISVND